MSMTNFPGQVVLVGAGPGDPDLLTLAAVKALRNADVIVHDRLVSDEVMAMIPNGVALINVGKAPHSHPVPQHDINDMLVRLARRHRAVVRLKGGDPYMFARGSEEAEVLRAAGVPVTAIPGISAAQGVAAATGAPLTHRGLATGVRFVTGHCRAGATLDLDWTGLTDPQTTLVFYMGRGHAKEIADNLMAAGMAGEMPAMLVADGTRPTQVTRFTTMSDLARSAEAMPSAAPVLMVIGRVVDLAERAAENGALGEMEPIMARAGHG
ncbi:uroporphyrinogen-III C-methyltransferase [Primorskyibacter sp. S187A]|uniref:uroporphyrinogen-III C-methyltransferase n=1 Tax=Primorskyibacter sp. S187A TaxID=3415130 RepID=UPI003C7C2354